MRQTVLRALLGCVATLLLAAPAVFAQGSLPVKPDYVSSDNVELVNRIKTVGDGVGARLVGKYLYVTSTKSLSIFDIATDPENPQPAGLLTLDVEFENEEVPTNGKILGISGQIGCKDPTQSNILNPQPGTSDDEATGCLSLYDVSNPAAVRYIKSVAGAGNHTSTCVLDCQYFFGDDGAVTDARKPEDAKVIGDWTAGLGVKWKRDCHHVREIQPGIIFGSCQPLVLFSVRPEDGGSILDPVLLAQATNKDERFIHSNRWPRAGLDKFALVGGEKNATPSCSDSGVSAFMVWDALPALDPMRQGFKKGGTFNLLSEVRPENGNYLDGHSPYNGLGCSVHWFQEHPTFRDGGLVALAEYENGTRFLQITSTGKIIEQGYYLPLGGSASAPHWNPNGKVVYNIDYARGVDVLRYKGLNYVPPAAGLPDPPQPGSTPGTNGVRDQKAIAEQRAREEQQNKENCSLIATEATATAQGKGLKLGAGGARFDAQVFQVSKGRSVITKKRVARFKGVTSAVWKGLTPRKKPVSSGFYLVRITTGGKSRQLTFQRTGRGFATRPDFQTGSSCGALRGFQLRSPVFGGRRNVAASVAVRLTQNADQVIVEAMRAGKVVKTVTRKNVKANRTLKLAVSARGVKRGAITFRVRAIRGNTLLAQTSLTATRL